MIRVGVVGLGTIGRNVCRALDAGIPGLALTGANARNAAQARAFLDALTRPAPFLTLDELVNASDVVVEAASHSALTELAPRVLGAGRDLLVLSSGALLGQDEWCELARRSGCRIHVPSGGIAGLDAVKAASVGAITLVSVETRKAPARWKGAPFVIEHAIDLDAIITETVLFEGTALEACRAFPASVNVVGAVSLAGVGPERTEVRIMAVPGLEQNMHRLVLEGEFGCLRLEIANVPSDNPRTAKMAYLSTIALLRELGAAVRVGT